MFTKNSCCDRVRPRLLDGSGSGADRRATTDTDFESVLVPADAGVRRVSGIAMATELVWMPKGIPSDSTVGCEEGVNRKVGSMLANETELEDAVALCVDMCCGVYVLKNDATDVVTCP